MRLLITGANGFVGRALLRRLLSQGLGSCPVASLVASDLALDGLPDDARIQPVMGSIAEPGVLERALATPVDAVFHLASMPGGAAEQAPDAARRVNLDATLRLVALLRAQGGSPRLVFASTVAVYGDSLPAWVDDATPARPALSYGAHKLAAEVLLADADRRGWVRVCSLRLPGIVARPGDGAGLMSAFMSQLFWKLRDNEPIVLPVSPEGTAWWLSMQTCVDHLLLAAALDTTRLDPRRVVQVPAQHLSMQQVIAALTHTCGPGRDALVRFAPQPEVQRLFASYPPLRTPAAEALGFSHDGSAAALVSRALKS